LSVHTKPQCKPVKRYIDLILGLSSAIVVGIESKAEQQNSGNTRNIKDRPAALADAPLDSGVIGNKVQNSKQTATNKKNKLNN